ncbi:MAG: Tol-Pal system beta propeller repeat protein TolB [Alphaproteobacteria bacterium]|mgnify:CR=1 FL=1|nr:Tol-Pal system beta propeller repeat protein TolB [Rhodospirillaceae bacterium]MDP6403722.1 Tol-Pal system beta propeller repeat protein TolB [Alphaproteobacteria bacterium]MDP6621782.1 Tol-Pal system beta propeller repeat protein TolB [Alphaproteobacteria bacterium]
MISTPLCKRMALALVVLLGLTLAAGPAAALLKIDITQGNVDPLPLAVSEFDAAETEARRLGRGIADVISADLERSGLFQPIDRGAFIQTPAAMRVQPRFGDWRIINAQALVTGTTKLGADGKLRAEFRLWDVFAEQQMTGLVYTTAKDNWRRIAHLIADAIYKRLTGEDGYFDTRIVYVSESGPKTKLVKRLSIMDQDGYNNRYLTDGSHLVLTPRFSPTAQEITYLSYFHNTPRVYIYNIDSGQQEVLGDFPGMTFAPRFSPDGNKVVMSLITGGDNSELYSMDLRTRNIVQLTNNPAIDTSPSYAPDGSRITFNSDRGGSQQIYVMDADGSKVHRVSFGDGRYATPVWSPRGDLIAFTKMRRGRFYIGVMRTDGSGERLLTESFLDEGPTWAPNGRVIMFFRQARTRADGSGGESLLWSVDLTGRNLRRVVTPQDASDPAWSPLFSRSP